MHTTDKLMPPRSNERFFKYLNPLEAKFFLSITTPISLEAGERLERTEAAFDHLYVIREGLLEVMSDQAVVATLHEGDVLGELAFMTGIPWAGEVRAIEPTTLHVFTREQLRELTRQEPELLSKLILALCDVLSTRLRTVIEQTPAPCDCRGTESA